MARTIAQIQQSIIDAKNADATLSGLTSTSSVAKWNLWAYIVATCQWVTETLFDAHKAEVSAIISAGKAHTLNWYVLKAKAFQFGYSLPVDAGGNATSDVYDIVDPTAMVVNMAAAVEQLPLNRVRIKVASTSGGALAATAGPAMTALTAYMNQIKDAGVRLVITTGAADNLQLVLTILYDATVLDSTGARLDGSAATPVKDAINAFLTSLPFNGVFILGAMEDAIKAVEGVTVAIVGLAQANYAMTPYVAITGQYVPDAGYMNLDGGFFDGNVNYMPYTVTDI